MDQSWFKTGSKLGFKFYSTLDGSKVVQNLVRVRTNLVQNLVHILWYFGWFKTGSKLGSCSDEFGSKLGFKFYGTLDGSKLVQNLVCVQTNLVQNLVSSFRVLWIVQNLVHVRTNLVRNLVLFMFPL